MKHLIFICLVSLLITSCQEKKASVSVNGTTSYACPMKCEGEKVYPVAGKCPVCGMNLEPVSGAAASIVYEMRLASIPATPEAGKPTVLSFTPKISGNETSRVPLDEVHEKKIHVIIVSKDLGWYNHIHPDYQTDGSYIISETFPTGGEYIIFADYHPTGGGNQVERKTISVSGTPKQAESFTSQVLSTQTDGYVVTLKPSADNFLTNNMNHLGVEVTQNGSPIKNFENIMGAKGHLVVISGDGQKYLHVHPDEVEGKLDLHTKFDQPGFYRAYFQFQTNGKLHTSYFTMEVKEGKPGELDTQEGHPEHGTGESGQEHTH